MHFCTAHTLEPYLDNYAEFIGVDFGKNVFIFLSNIGSEDINTETYKHYKKVKRREEILFPFMDF